MSTNQKILYRLSSRWQVCRTHTNNKEVCFETIFVSSYISVCRFCFHEKPVGPKFGSKVGPTYSSSNIKIWFQSPSRTSRARCLVQCVDGTSNELFIKYEYLMSIHMVSWFIYKMADFRGLVYNYSYKTAKCYYCNAFYQSAEVLILLFELFKTFLCLLSLVELKVKK